MSHFDNQRALLDLAYQFERGEELSAEQRRFLSVAFYRIGNGEDANKVLKVRPGVGQKKSDIISRARMSMILHWVAGAVQKDPESGQDGIAVEKACELAMTTIVPIAKARYPGADARQYDADYIMRCWSEPAYAHMRSPERGRFDPDFPYRLPPEVKDLK